MAPQYPSNGRSLPPTSPSRTEWSEGAPWTTTTARSPGSWTSKTAFYPPEMCRRIVQVWLKERRVNDTSAQIHGQLNLISEATGENLFVSLDIYTARMDKEAPKPEGKELEKLRAGVKRLHDAMPRRCHAQQTVTVFSAPNYCYRCGNQGAIIEFDEALEHRVLQYEPAPRSDMGDSAKAAESRELPDYFL